MLDIQICFYEYILIVGLLIYENKTRIKHISCSSAFLLPFGFSVKLRILNSMLNFYLNI